MSNPNAQSKSGIYFFVVHSEPSKFMPAFLTKFFTGSPAFHAGFADLNTGQMIDMNKSVRVVGYRYRPPKYDLRLYPAHDVTREGLDKLVLANKDVPYGYVDYIGFGFRWFYRLIGNAIPDFGGVICSEMVCEWSNTFGYKFPTRPVLSPGELEDYIVNEMKLERFL